MSKKETNFCKGIAIILMLFHHLFVDSTQYHGINVNFFPLTEGRVYYLALTAKICVAVFVFLSGYGLTATYNHEFFGESPSRERFASFIWKRYWKLMTGYWFVFLLTLICQPLGRTVVDAYGTSVKHILAYGAIDFMGVWYLFGTPSLNPTWWYMMIAIFLIIFIPVAARIMKMVGPLAVLAGTILMMNILGVDTFLARYIFPGLLGAACYEWDLFGYVKRLFNGKTYGIFIKGLVELFILFVLFKYRMEFDYYGIIDGLIVMMLAVFVNTALINIPVLSHIMQKLGEHSSNMFMIHNQIYAYYFLGFIYSFKNWMLITCVLVIISFIVSVAIELVKKRIGYQKMMVCIGECVKRRLYET